jgi:predicted porin
MKKPLFALSFLAVAASASAQSSVTLFGIADIAVQRGTASGAGSGSRTQMISGGYSGSRVGFRGQEDLGGGLSASFWLEAGFSSDSGLGGSSNSNNQASGAIPAGGLMFNRRSTVSLAGRWGEVRAGRDFTPQYLNLSTFDPFGNNGVGASVLIFAPAAAALAPGGTSGPLVRASNTIAYHAPRLGGFYGQVMYYFGENVHNGAATEDDGSGYGGRFGYVNGPVDVALSHGRIEYAKTAATGDFKTWNLGGSYDFGVVKVTGVYARAKRDSAPVLDARGWMIGGIAPFGQHAIRAQVSSYEIERVGAPLDREVKQLAVGHVYNLSKRTLLYTTVARNRNTNWGPGAGVTLGGATIGATVTKPNSTGMDIGIRHVF